MKSKKSCKGAAQDKLLKTVHGFMSKKTGESGKPAAGRSGRSRTVCKIAYSINGWQPVSSTILGDQPLFYMDEEYEYDSYLSEFEEDSYLYSTEFDNEFNMLEKDVADLRRKIEAYDRMSLEFAQPADKRFQEFLTDISVITKPDSAKNKIDPQVALEKVINILKKSRMATELLAHAERHKVELAIGAHTETATYNPQAGKIFLNPYLDRTQQVLLTVRELRRHWHHRQGILCDPLNFSPDQAVFVNRALEADRTATIIRIAWELQLAGQREIWEWIENSTMADLGHALAREAFLDFRTLNNGLATGAVFETWFLSERCRHYDRELIQRMLADDRGFISEGQISGHILGPDFLYALGAQPFGKNYLAAYADIILEDPLFMEVRDRSNANFLWFVKFERSFREAEQELQSGEFIHSSAGSPQSVPGNYEHAQDPFYDHSMEPQNTSAEIIYVQFGNRPKSGT